VGQRQNRRFFLFGQERTKLASRRPTFAAAARAPRLRSERGSRAGVNCDEVGDPMATQWVHWYATNSINAGCPQATYEELRSLSTSMVKAIKAEMLDD
jgi:hypothetical protein